MKPKHRAHCRWPAIALGAIAFCLSGNVAFAQQSPHEQRGDLLTDERFLWRIGANYVRLEPGVRQAHLIRVEI